MKKKIFTILIVTLCLVVCSAKAAPMGTAFTYQGRLIDDNIAADGLYDFRFELYDDPNAGTQQGPTVYIDNNDVNDGYFTVKLDFGSDVFNGDGRWLDIGVRPSESSDPNYTSLSPRQEITSTPYALQTRGIFADSNDNIGIGTTEPDNILHIESENVSIKLKDSSASGNSALSWIEGHDSEDVRKWILGDRSPSNDDIGLTADTGNLFFSAGQIGAQITLKTSGNVGIGTTSPAEELYVEKSQNSGTVIGIENTDTGASAYAGLKLTTDGDTGWIYRTSNAYSDSSIQNNLVIEDGGGVTIRGLSEVARFMNTGNVGIGTTSPTEKLEVNGNLKVTGNIVGGMKTYDSGWFAVSAANNEYAKTHNLGTTKVSVTALLSGSADGTDNWICFTPYDSNARKGIFVGKITSSQIVVKTGTENLGNPWGGSAFTSGYARIIMLALE